MMKRTRTTDYTGLTVFRRLGRLGCRGAFVARVGDLPSRGNAFATSQYGEAGDRASLAATINGTADFKNSYSYDALSRLTVMQQGQNGGNTVAPKELDYTYDPLGDVLSRTAYSSVTTPRTDAATGNYGYNTLGQLTSLNYTSNAGATSIDDFGWNFDSLDRVSTFSSVDGTATYGYDSVNEVTSAVYSTNSGGHQPPNESYNFDANGNRTNVDGTGTTLGVNNEVTNDGTYTYTFDAEGNRLTRTQDASTQSNQYKVSYSYDYRNRLVEVQDFNNSNSLTEQLNYTYDVYDRLIERDDDVIGQAPTTTNYVWDGNNVVLAFNGTGDLTARYLNGPNTSAYDQYFTTLAEEDVSSGKVNFDLVDQLGSNRDIVNASGQLVDHRVFNSYGVLAYQSAPTVTPLGGFTGGVYDPSTGMIYLLRRWYDPAATVWIQADPEGFAAGDANLARYVGNDPTDDVDPDGLYGRGGHFWTTYIVAIAAARSNSCNGNESDLDREKAYALAYYSQLPDQDQRYEAISVFWAQFNPFASSPFNWAPRVFNWLHSLHGGGAKAVQQRRARLAQLISDGTDDDGNKLSPWQLGFLIHALGDAYAHTYTSRSGLHAYGWPWGHARHSHTPDIIASNREQYKTYVRELYGALGGCNQAGNELLQRLIQRADISEEDADAEAIWLGLFARQYAGYVRYYQPTDNFNIDENMDTPTPDEVSDLMGIIPEASSGTED